MIKLDFLFLEFYIQKKYEQRVEEYFKIGKQSISEWRKTKIIPPKRLLEFQFNEGSIDPKILFEKLYN